MAFKKLEGGLLKAIQLDKKTKSVTGFLMGVEQPKNCKFKASRIINLQKLDGAALNVWSSVQINQRLLTEDTNSVLPAYQGVLVRLTFAGTTKIKGRKEPMRNIEIEVDTDKRLPRSGKSYQLDGGKRKLARK